MPAPGQPGRLFTWGSGAGGQLGLGATTESPVPMEVPETLSASGEPVQWVQVACGAGVTLAVSTAGELYSFGKCGYFSLGHGESVQEVNVPTRVEALDGIPIAAVAAGEYHCAAVSVEGDVFTWGWGGGFMYGCGGLGHGDTTSQPRPALVEWFGDQDVHIKAVACGERHTLALSNSGLVFSFGNGEFGRCGNGKRSQKLPEVVDVLEGTPCTRIAAGSAFSLALSEDNDLYVWGRNDQAQLGLGASVTMDPNTMEEYPLVLDTLGSWVSLIACVCVVYVLVSPGGCCLLRLFFHLQLAALQILRRVKRTPWRRPRTAKCTTGVPVTSSSPSLWRRCWTSTPHPGNWRLAPKPPAWCLTTGRCGRGAAG